MKKTLALIIAIPLIAASCDSLLGIGPSGTHGVFKSSDAGESYNTANKVAKGGEINNIAVPNLVFDPSNPSTLHLASTSGIYKTTDAAASWQYILSGIQVTDNVIDLNQPQTLYASGISGSNGKIIKS